MYKQSMDSGQSRGLNLILSIRDIHSYIHSPKQGSEMSESSTLPVPELQLHKLGVPPCDVLFVGQEIHIPEATYSFTRQTTRMKVVQREVSVHIMCSTCFVHHGLKNFKYIFLKYLKWLVTGYYVDIQNELDVTLAAKYISDCQWNKPTLTHVGSG